MYEYRVKSVDRIVDGDTIDVSIDLGFDLTKKERVRVAGVDTPEIRTRNDRAKMLGYDATAFAESWFSAATTDLIVRTEKDGKFGRMLGWFYRGEECYNHRLVDEGYAWVYTSGSRVDPDDMASLMLLLNKRGYETWEDYAEQ